MRLLSLLPRILAVFLIALPSIIAVSQPKLMEACDFVMTFYPAGAMIASGQAANIYPPPTATSFVGTPFDVFTHKLLPHLKPELVAIYMYPPLVAAVFVPFSMLPPAVALVLWQMLSVAVVLLVAHLFAAREWKKTFDYFFMMVLFCPVFHTLLIGHLGIVLGLLPLAIGYLLVSKGKDLPGGIVWGLLAFKPQFLPAALLVAGALFFAKRMQVAIGMAIGVAAFVAASSAVLGPAIFESWLHSFKMSDTIFANPAYGFPEYMVVSLPAVLLQSFSHDMRGMVKLPIYAIAGAIGLYSLWRCTTLTRVGNVRTEGEDDAAFAAKKDRALALTMTTGLLVLPLVLPHFLFYDMCGLVPICIIAYQDFWSKQEAFVMRVVRRLMWWVCNIYYVTFMFATVKPMKQWYALILVLFFAFLYIRVLGLASFAVPDKDAPAEPS